MNGLSLLVVLATVGVDVGWESTAAGKLAYTIRIESLLVKQLREGSAIESTIDKNDRGLRNFRVAMGPKNTQNERLATATANEVDYGWRPNTTGGMDYYVQLSLERLETLSKGIPIECVVHPDVPEVERIFVFVGDSPLPRDLPQGSPAPRTLSNVNDPQRAGNTVAPASGTDASLSTPQFGGSRFGTTTDTRNPAANTGSTNSLGQPATQSLNERWAQDTRGTSVGQPNYGPEPPRDYNSQLVANQAQAAANQAQAAANQSQADRYNPYRNNTLPVPQLNNTASNNYDYTRDPNYDYAREQYARRTELLAQQQTAANQSLQQTYSPPLAQPTAQGQQYAAPQAAPPLLAQQQPTYATAATNAWPANPQATAPAYTYAPQPVTVPAAATKEAVEEVKPWTPLILTTLALFASIGANAYLGWLAWSFFWRFRDAASDLSRARSTAFSAGGGAR